MAHDHHGHSHAPTHYGRAFAIGITLNVGFVLLELTYGLLSHSLALIADAGHNASDVLGLIIAWTAHTLSRRRPTTHYTYGLRRTSILASLTNAVLLLIAVGAILVEAARRFTAPAPVEGGTVIWVAAVGILINAATAALFASGRKGDLNLRGAYQHMLADAAVSLAVVVAGALIAWTHWAWLDPVISVIVALVILAGTWGLLRDSVNLALDAVPEGIDLNAVRQHLLTLPGVTAVHDLHVWGMSTTETALTAHLIMPGGAPDDAFYAAAQHDLHERFGIEHPTLQVERGTATCRFTPDEVV
ncbi:cation diffusion facilitator family transporter [Deinococcus maricopensis]|uniref:Cation diffusion facilitator family transporter n=1 Tax=Deinococcus maricopensis (strain DSM 21211 / LMG 22137 / NRRL B-23946 / LB-34) TaxID=709986 RepID=E8U358_DEIML|nr:cation diffusion facilitator family transporter [Deinococcus maricopensis]ADV66003.1 cation diffusion facilitator family transporter [Deinococcus maricopensis DSM 21211]